MLQIDKLIRKYFLFLIVIFLPGCSVTVTCPSGYKISYAICVEDPGEKSVNALNTKKSGENNIESLRDQNIAKIINSTYKYLGLDITIFRLVYIPLLCLENYQ